jgi:hypothetical protein
VARVKVATGIHVSALRDFTRPETIVRRRVEWGIDATPRKLAPDWAGPNDPLVGCSRNGALVTDWDAQLADGDFVHYWARPGIEIAVGATLFSAIAAAAPLWNMLVLGLLLRMLIPSARKPAQPGDDSSATYGFTNLQRNVRGEGTAIQVTYGQNRVAGPVVNEYIRSSIDANGNPLSEYVALILLGEGPIYAVGDKTEDGGPFREEDSTGLATLEINNLPASSYGGVEAHVRLGTLDQEAIAEFADPVLAFEVAKTLRDTQTPAESPTGLTHATTVNDVPGATTAIATIGQFPAGNANITKWGLAGPSGGPAQESYTSGDDADEFTAILEFPQGLVSYSLSTGAALTNTAIFQFRYCEVDGSGVPFGSYVVLPAEQATLAREGLVRLESRHRFYLPSSYSAPTIGLFAQSRALAAANPGLYTTVAGTFTPAGPSELEFSVAFWTKRRNTQANGTENILFQWWDSAGQEGFIVSAIGSALGGTLKFTFGTGGSTQTFVSTAVANTTDVTNWHFIVATYEAEYDGTNTRVRFYVDGVLRAATTGSTQAVLDSTATLRIGSNSHTAPTQGADAHFDETTVWSRCLTPYEVASKWNGGLPSATDAAASGLIIGGRFDNGTGVSPNLGLPAFGPHASGAWILGSGTNAAADPALSASAGIVRVPEQGTPKRGKFLVECLRLDTEDTESHRISEVSFQSIQLRTFQQYTYPGMALLAVKVPATDQLSGSAPLITVRTDGRLVPVWDGADATYPNMVATYSRNPAWVAADALLNTDYGLGSVYKPSDLDVGAFVEFANFCDTRVYDNLDRARIVTANYLDSAAEAVTFTGPYTAAGALGAVYGDVIRYRVASLPLNFPQPTTEPTGKYLKPILAGLTPGAPAWLTATAALAAQEIVFVEFRPADSSFYIYTRTTQTLGAGQSTYTVSGGQSEANGLEMHDVRCRFDGVFDRTDNSAWDAVLQILATARAAPVRIGSRVSIFFDDVAEPVALIGMGSIIEGSWSQGFMGVSDRPNAESTEINDELRNWEGVPVEDEHPTVTDPGSASSFRWRRVRSEGVTRRGQAKRNLRRDLNAFALVRRWCAFDMGIDALPLVPGEVAYISHDVPQYGLSGRIHTADSTTSIKLDRPITLEAATSYQVQIQDTSSGTRETRAITSVAGTYAAGAAITVSPAFGFTPEKDDTYALGEVALGEAKLFRLVESKFDPQTLRRRTRWLEYVEDAYDDEFGTLPLTGTSALPVPAAPLVPPGVENLSVTEETSRGPDGGVRTAARVSFSHIAETYAAVGASDVYLTVGGHENGIGDHKAHLAASATSVLIEYPFERDETYTLWVIPRTRDGLNAAAACWVEFTPSGLAPTPAAPTNVRYFIAGDQVVYRWDDADAEDRMLDGAATVEGRQGGWILGLRVFDAPAAARCTPPIPMWASVAANENGVAETDIVVRTKLATGQYSDAVVLEVESDDVTVVSALGNVALNTVEESVVWST